MKLEWASAWAFSRSKGMLKTENSDFIVTERLPEQPSGEGEHVWLTLKKEGQNTAWVARQLSKWAGLKPRDVSYAGLKDRHAITQQTFSVHLPGKQTPSPHLIHIDGVTLVEAERHSRKLKTGQLIGNAFSIRVRQTDQPIEEIKKRWDHIVEHGVPNYFGPQRFGFDGQNVEKGTNWLLGNEKAPRQYQSIYLSAVRSYLFNQLLENRVKDGTWNVLIGGDFVQFTEGKSGFYCESPEQNDHDRCQQGKLSPCASLPGFNRESFEQLDPRENTQLSQHSELLNALIERKINRQFRKLRIFPENASFDVIESDPVFHFFLPAGSFATTVLTELFDWTNESDEPGME